MNKLLIIFILLLPLNCKSKADSTKMSDSENVVLISKGNLYGAGAEGIEKQNTVISSQKDWEYLLGKMNSVNAVSDSFEITEIDFSKYSVLAIFDEVKTTGGHSIELNVTEESERFLVEVLYEASEGMATTVMAQPYYLVKIMTKQKPIIVK